MVMERKQMVAELRTLFGEFSSTISQYNDEINALRDENEKLTENITNLRRSQSSLVDEISTLSNIFAKEIKTRNALDQELTSQIYLLNKKAPESIQSLDRGQLVVLTDLQKRMEQTRESLTEVTSTLRTTESEISKKNKEISQADARSGGRRGRRADDANQARQSLRSLQREKRQLLSQRATLTNQGQSIESELSNLIGDVDNSEISDLLPQLETISELVKQFDVVSESLTEFDDLNDKVQSLKSEIEKLEDTIKVNESTSGDLAKAQREHREMMGRVVSSLISAAVALERFIDSLRKTQQQLGVGIGTAAGLRIDDFFNSLGSRIEALTSFGAAARVSGTEIMGARSSFATEFGGLLSSGAAREVAQTVKDLGISATDFATARRAFLTQTLGDVSASREIFDGYVSRFEDAGMTARDVASFIASSGEVLAKSGLRYQESIKQAAITAKRIGVELSKVDAFGDNVVGNFEGFLMGMAELGSMGFNLDANRLAVVSESGDIGALQDELRSQLAATGKDIQDLSRSQQQVLQRTFGMSFEDLTRLSGDEVATGGEAGRSPEETQRDALLGRLINIADVLSGLQVLLSTIAAATSATAVLMAVMAKGRMGGMLAGRLGTGKIGGSLLRGGGRLLKGAGIGLLGGLAGGVISSVGDQAMAESGGGQGQLLSVGGSALSGAAVGAGLGSIIAPGIGTGLGALLGGSIAGISKFMQNREQYNRVSTSAAAPPSGQAMVDDASQLMGASSTMMTANVPTQSAPPEIINKIELDLSSLERKMEMVVDAIAGMSVKLDGNEVGRVLMDGERAIENRGTLRRQRST